jgi:hypothetical protein
MQCAKYSFEYHCAANQKRALLEAYRYNYCFVPLQLLIDKYVGKIGMREYA